MAHLTGDAELEYTALAFTRDGTRLLAVSGAPSLRLSVWSIEEKQMLVSADVLMPCVATSANPADASLICTESGRALQLWKLNKVYEHYALHSIDLQPTDDMGSGAMWTCHTWADSQTLLVGSDTGAVARFEAAKAGAAAVSDGSRETSTSSIDGVVAAEQTVLVMAPSAISGIVVDTSHMLVACRDGSLSWYLLSGGEALFSLTLGLHITNVSSSAHGRRLLLAAADGSCTALDYKHPMKPLPDKKVTDKELSELVAHTPLGSFHSSAVLGASLLTLPADDAALEYVLASVGADGTVRTVDCDSLECTGYATLLGDAVPSSICASAAGQLVAVGAADGVLRVYMYDRRQPAEQALVLIYRTRLSESALIALSFDNDGSRLAAAAEDGYLFFTYPTTSLAQPIGLHQLPAPASALAWCVPAYAGAPPQLLVACAGIVFGPGNGGIFRMDAPPQAKDGFDPLVRYSNKELGRSYLRLKSPAVQIAPVPTHFSPQPGRGMTSFYALCGDGALRVYTIGDDREPNDLSLGVFGAHSLSFDSHEKTPTSLAFSQDGGLIATGGAEGSVCVRSVEDPNEEPQQLRVHGSVQGGVSGLALISRGSDDSKTSTTILSVGHDGVFYQSELASTRSGPLPIEPPRSVAVLLERVPDRDSQEIRLEEAPAKESTGEEGEEAAELPPSPGAGGQAVQSSREPTVVELVAEGGGPATGLADVSSAARDATQAEVEKLRAELLELIETNAGLDDEDLEKLPPSEFIIDLQQQQQWRDEGAQRVATLKEQICRDNLRKELIMERMKGEFWDAMEQPKVTMHALQLDGGELLGCASGKGTLDSYALAKETTSAARQLAQVKLLRRAELLVEEWELGNAPAGPGAESDFEDPAGFGADVAAVGVVPAKKAPASQPPSSPTKEPATGNEDEDEGDAEEDTEGAQGESRACAKSRPLLYEHFEVYSHWRRAAQVVMHTEQQKNIKADFNGRFNKLLELKGAEIEKLHEKQQRVKEILSEMKKLGVDEGEAEPLITMQPSEEPERVLQVHDDEIKSEKFLSEAERAQQAKLKAEAEARAAAASADNIAVRGLTQMMNNTLETRKEEDEIFREIVLPEWASLPAEELSDEQKATLAALDEEQKQLDAEREKRAKGLQTELQKTRQDIGDVCRAFNERLSTLVGTKLDYERAVYESELLCIKWAQGRLRRETAERRAKSLREKLNQARDARVGSSMRLAEFKSEVEKVREENEQLATEERTMERSFRRDFADVPDFYEAMLKLYRRRDMVNKSNIASPQPSPRSSPGGMMGGFAIGGFGDHDLEQEDGPMMAEAGEEAPLDPRDPWSALDRKVPDQVIEPLDAAVDMPEGLSFDVWDRLVEARSARIEVEEESKTTGAKLAEMNKYLGLLAAEDERLSREIDETATELTELRQTELHEGWNITLPFKLKQGQIEVEEAAVVTDFGDALLVHKGVVRELNEEIKKLAGEKVEILREILDFRRGIVVLQWENERAEMEAVDLIERTKEFQLLRVTKDLQELITGGSEENQAAEVAALERKLEMFKSSHEAKVADFQRQVGKLKRMVADKRAEMEGLRGQIEQLESSVMEREMIYEVQAKNKDSSGDAYKRFEEVHMKRKLQTLVSMQTQEIQLLREELDRLRRRTFPTFTHIEATRATDGTV